MQLALFDIDGTLIHTGGAGVNAFARAFAEEFHIVRATEGIQFAGRTDTGLFREMCLKFQIDPTATTFAGFFDRYVFWLDHFLEILRGRICPGVTRFIHQLEERSPRPLLGLLTGNIRLGAEIKLRHFGLWQHFRVGAFADDHEDRNEISVIAHRRGSALLEREVDPENVLVIGDTPHDVACGRAIGAVTLAVATGNFSIEELLKHRPTWAVQSLEQVCSESFFDG